MAIIDALIPSASADIVAIFPEAQEIDVFGLVTVPGFIPIQVFEDARPMRVQVSEPSKFMVHPLESGAQVTDHRIILPIEITITFILRPENYRNTYLLMRQAYLSAFRFSVQTKTNTYTGMYISDLPHEEDPAFFDTVTMVVQFREVQFFQAQLQLLSDFNVINPIDASTILRGEQLPTSSSASQDDQGSVLFEAFGDFF
jgi:hypothetical protein